METWNVPENFAVALTKTRNRAGPSAARSARTKSAPSPSSPERRSGLAPAHLAAVNRRRKRTRNKWRDHECVERPDSKKAAEAKHAGSGGGYAPRKWC